MNSCREDLTVCLFPAASRLQRQATEFLASVMDIMLSTATDRDPVRHQMRTRSKTPGTQVQHDLTSEDSATEISPCYEYGKRNNLLLQQTIRNTYAPKRPSMLALQTTQAPAKNHAPSDFIFVIFVALWCYLMLLRNTPAHPGRRQRCRPGLHPAEPHMGAMALLDYPQRGITTKAQRSPSR